MITLKLHQLQNDYAIGFVFTQARGRVRCVFPLIFPKNYCADYKKMVVYEYIVSKLIYGGKKIQSMLNIFFTIQYIFQNVITGAISLFFIKVLRRIGI